MLDKDMPLLRLSTIAIFPTAATQGKASTLGPVCLAEFLAGIPAVRPLIGNHSFGYHHWQ